MRQNLGGRLKRRVRHWATRIAAGMLVGLILLRPVALAIQPDPEKAAQAAPVIESITVKYRDLDPQGKSIYEAGDKCVATVPTENNPDELQSKVGKPVDHAKLDADMSKLIDTSNAKKGQFELVIDKKTEKLAITFIIDNQLTDLQVSLAKALAATKDEYQLLPCWQKAQDYYKKALQLKPNPNTEALIWNNLGNLYKQITESSVFPSGTAYYRAALNAYNKALPTFQQEQAVWLEAMSLINQARLYRDLGDFEQSLSSYTQALPLIRRIRQQPTAHPFYGTLQQAKLDKESSEILPGWIESGLLFDLATNYAILGDYQQAIAWLKDYELRIQNSQWNPRTTGLTKKYAQGQDPASREGLTRFFDGSQKIFESGSLLLAAFISADTGDTEKSCFYQKESQRKVQLMMTEMKSLAELSNSLGSAKESRSNLNDVIPKFFALLQGTNFGNLVSCEGQLASRQSTTQLAELLEFVLTEAAKQEDFTAFTPYLPLIPGIFAAFDNTNESQRTLALLEKFLPLWESSRGFGLDQQAPWAKILFVTSLGDAYAKLNRIPEAIQTYKTGLQSLTLNTSSGIEETLKVNLLEGLGKAYASSTQPEQALKVYREAFMIREARKQFQELAENRYRIAQLETRLGNWTAARTQIESAISATEAALPTSLKISKESGVLSISSRASFDLPGKRGMFGVEVKPSAGSAFGKQAPSKTDPVDSDLDKACTTLTTFLACKQKYYQFYVDLLMQRYQTQDKTPAVAAFETSERARAFSPELFRAALKVSPNSGSTSLTKTPSNALQESAFAKPLKLKEIQRQLDPDTVLLEYFLGQEQSYLWLVSADGFETVVLPVGEEAVATKARAFYDLLISPVGRVQPKTTAAVGKELSTMLLGQVAPKLKGKRLLIVNDGILQYIPFGVLPNPLPISTPPIPGEFAARMQPLLVEHEIVNLPSASALGAIRARRSHRPIASKTLAVFADPVFNRRDERYQALLPRDKERPALPTAQPTLIADDFEELYPRLPGSATEAEAILQMVPKGQATDSYQGFAANLPTALSNEMSKYRILHFATHGIFNTRSPQRSGLVLSTIPNPIPGLPSIPPSLSDARSGIVLSALDQTGLTQRGMLTPRNAFEMSLSAADLVVLSGCRTGLGQNIRGEGLVGLTGGLMSAGTDRVVVSLWSVQDTATTHLMREFYQRMLDPAHPEYSPSPAKALRSAQLAMWRDSQWQTPYKWAAFTIQGEWQ